MMAFGSSAAVVAWDRVGAALAFLARKAFRLPVLRWVDDFFGISEQPDHAKDIFARMCRRDGASGKTPLARKSSTMGTHS